MRPNIHTCCPALLSCWKLLILTRPLLAPEQPCNDNWDFIVLIQVRNKLQWMKISIQRVLTETQTIKMKNNIYKIGLIILQISLLWQKAKMIWFSFDLGRFQLHPMLFNNAGKLARVYPFYTVCQVQEEPLFLVKEGPLSVCGLLLTVHSPDDQLLFPSQFTESCPQRANDGGQDVQIFPLSYFSLFGQCYVVNFSV